MVFHPNHLWTYVAQLPTFPQPLVDGEREQWWTRLVISLPSVHRGNQCIPDMAEAESSVAVHGRVTEATGFQLPSLPWRHPSKISLATASGFRKHIYFFLLWFSPFFCFCPATSPFLLHLIALVLQLRKNWEAWFFFGPESVQPSRWYWGDLRGNWGIMCPFSHQIAID